MRLVEVSERDAGAAGASRRRPTRDERRLAARLRRRDRGALAELYAAYGRMTFGLLLDLLGDRGAAEDVQQQVFLQVWQQGETYDPRRASPATWVMMIARATGSLGTFRVDATGAAAVRVPLGVRPERFAAVDVSVERADGDPGHSGRSLLRGAV